MRNLVCLLICMVSISARADWSALVQIQKLNCSGLEEYFPGDEETIEAPSSIKVEMLGSMLPDESYQSSLKVVVDHLAPISIPTENLSAVVASMVGVYFQMWVPGVEFNFGSGDPVFKSLSETGDTSVPLTFNGSIALVIPNLGKVKHFALSCNMTLFKYCKGKFDDNLCAKINL